MARPLRIEYEGALYHITARGNERGKIFFTKTDYRKFKEYLANAQTKYGFILHCYVLMTNHYHLLIETPEKNLSKIMHHLNSSYTTYINIKRKRSGHLFQGRYKALLVDRDSYLLELSRYMHLNPVRAKMVERPEEYPYSSFDAFISGKDELVDVTPVLSMLSKDTVSARRKYKAFVESALNEEMESPLKSVYGGMILGSSSFLKDTLAQIEEELLNREETSHRRALQASQGVDDIVSIVCERHSVTREELLNTERNDLRKMCIYLMKRYVAKTNRQIGEQLGGMSGFAVAKAYQRMMMDLKTDVSLKKEMGWFDEVLSRVKG
ncbi:MAG: transposase [Desulfuromonadaceae bacterium]|nr:transposase [Desulfuromonadaceae bacterium]MDD2848944.1 transposase [Desulfuromonadaceae bacterium]MDD4130293.1 transposase [Desulfuromonadaceae bacterium]